jgi:hypothetical protein
VAVEISVGQIDRQKTAGLPVQIGIQTRVRSPRNGFATGRGLADSLEAFEDSYRAGDVLRI